MHIKLIYNNIAWVLIIDDYDYTPEQKETGPIYDSGGEPGFPESIELNKYYLELDSGSFNNSKLINMINNQLTKSNRLGEQLLMLYNEDIHKEALMLYHEELWP